MTFKKDVERNQETFTTLNQRETVNGKKMKEDEKTNR